MINSRWVWFVPHVNGIVIGAILFAANGFDINAVLGAWAFIGVVLAGYSSLLAALPVSHGQARMRPMHLPTRALTKTQMHYLNVTMRPR